MTDDDRLSAEFTAEDGRVLTRERLFRIGLHEGGLTPFEDGYILNGERFTPVDEP